MHREAANVKPWNGSNKCMTAAFSPQFCTCQSDDSGKRSDNPHPPQFLPRSSCLISFILIIRLIFHSDGLHFWGDYKNVCFLGNASSTEADDLLAGWRANLNSASSSPFSFFFPSCRLCVMAFHINHPPWLLTPCRKSWPSGLRLEL